MAASKAKGTVRTHTRKTASGGTTTVRQHSRTGRPRHGVTADGKPRRALVSPSHAWDLIKRAWRANRKKKRATAAVLGVLALGELAAWLTLEGTGLMLATAGALALGVAWLLSMAGGVELK